jgi:hypothetical protein
MNRSRAHARASSNFRPRRQPRCRLLQFFPKQSYGNMNFMPRKKKSKPLNAVQLVKEMARERVGAPSVEKVVPNKKRKPVKHKLTLGNLLEDQN